MESGQDSDKGNIFFQCCGAAGAATFSRFFCWSEPGAGAALLRRLRLHLLGKQKEMLCSCVKHDIKSSLEG